MVEIRRAEQRGVGCSPWLDARFTFSFGSYYDPEQIGFSDLLLLNDDIVRGGGGFATHEHVDVEVVSYVIEGSLAHADSTGVGSTVHAGEVLLMSAGRGITHSEFNASATIPVRFLQVWMSPSARGGLPRYSQRRYDRDTKRGRFIEIISPDGRASSMTWGADATVYAGVLASGQCAAVELTSERFAYVHVIHGRVNLNGVALLEGDGARVRRERRLAFDHADSAEVLVFDLPPRETPPEAPSL